MIYILDMVILHGFFVFYQRLPTGDFWTIHPFRTTPYFGVASAPSVWLNGLALDVDDVVARQVKGLRGSEEDQVWGWNHLPSGGIYIIYIYLFAYLLITQYTYIYVYNVETYIIYTTYYMTHISIYRYICNYVYTYINNQCISYIYWNYNQSLIDPFNIVKGWKYSWE